MPPPAICDDSTNVDKVDEDNYDDVSNLASTQSGIKACVEEIGVRIGKESAVRGIEIA
jgi:hypothetical protein